MLQNKNWVNKIGNCYNKHLAPPCGHLRESLCCTCPVMILWNKHYYIYTNGPVCKNLQHTQVPECYACKPFCVPRVTDLLKTVLTSFSNWWRSLKSQNPLYSNPVASVFIASFIATVKVQWPCVNHRWAQPWALSVRVWGCPDPLVRHFHR